MNQHIKVTVKLINMLFLLYKTFNKEEGITISELQPPEDNDGNSKIFSQIEIIKLRVF